MNLSQLPLVKTSVDERAQKFHSRIPGLALAAIIASIATYAGKVAPVVGAPVVGIVLGAILSTRAARRAILRPGIAFAGRTVLQVAVVVLGAQLSLRQVAEVGLSSLPVMLGTLVICLALAVLIGRQLRIEPELRTLIGVGTAICGASAIAAVSPVIRAKSSSVAYAISTIFLFNIAAVLLFPFLGHALGLSQRAFGLFAGTAVNDTSSVIAAAASYGGPASHYAVVVKLTRTLMIIPICLWLAAVTNRGDSPHQIGAPSPGHPPNAFTRARRLVPWFLVGFLIVAGANSIGLIPASTHGAVQNIALFLITIALSAIGLSVDVAALRRAGPKPLLLGGALWVTVGSASLLLQAAHL
jgi:uncharacterized integral membrane protein (TIGR00698 family)